VIVARAFAPPGLAYANARLPFDAGSSEHGTHVAGIAAGDDGTVTRTGIHLSGIAPRAYLGNYKAMGVPSQFGLNGNSPELAAAVEAAVSDGMDVINLSLGETDIEPTRDILARALNAAADAGVISTVAAGNSGDLGPGSIDSPASALKAIAAASSTGGHGSIETDTASDFSSIGPAPYSFNFKPDVTAPGDEVASSVPGGGYATLSGTSMAAPHVAGAAAVLQQRHPSWSPAQIKSALMTTGAPVFITREVSPLKEGGGRIDLPRADQPLLFTQPTALSFGLLRQGATVTRTLLLSDAGGGAGTWNAGVSGFAGATVSVPPQVSVPGSLPVRVAVGRAGEQDASGFIMLTRGRRRAGCPSGSGSSTRGSGRSGSCRCHAPAPTTATRRAEWPASRRTAIPRSRPGSLRCRFSSPVARSCTASTSASATRTSASRSSRGAAASQSSRGSSAPRTRTARRPHRIAVRREPVSRVRGTASPDRRRPAAGARDLRRRLRHARARPLRQVHLPPRASLKGYGYYLTTTTCCPFN
jgi:hypothetical protein